MSAGGRRGGSTSTVERWWARHRRIRHGTDTGAAAMGDGMWEAGYPAAAPCPTRGDPAAVRRIRCDGESGAEPARGGAAAPPPPTSGGWCGVAGSGTARLRARR
uniref:Uncharacterized protein n=1 Tax=Oryza nivara TaxID=4536 RepID=A0A0E0IAQ6_ORYNI